MAKTRKVLTINAAHCVWCGRQTAGQGCDCRTDIHDATISDNCDCETCQARREYTRKRAEHIDRMQGNAAHADDCLCTPCSTRRLHQEETAMSREDDDNLDDLPGYKPARNAQLDDDDELEPIPVESIDYGELSVFGDDDELVANAAGDTDGLTVNEAAPGGLPVIGLDYEAMSVFRPRR